jgi:spore coat polysaccharide biosynthesis protein SpsF (cytidylyltransferase family)
VVDINEIVIVVQARMGSTRLPGKFMLPMSGTTVIGYLLKSLEEHGFSRSQLCVTTSGNKENEKLVKHVTKMSYRCIVGSESNVLSRYQLAASSITAGTIVRLTGDNQFIDPALVECCIRRHFSSGAMGMAAINGLEGAKDPLEFL